MEEVLTCLAGQTCRDFEVLLACHRTTPEGLAAVHRVLAEAPEWLRERVRVLEVERPGRSSPLNEALDASRGRYAVVLDDDDAVTAEWVAAYAALEAQQPGVVLRSVALAQPVRPVQVADEHGPRGPVPVETEPAHHVWPDTFSIVDHLWDNASPPMTFAIPRGVFDDLGVRFDEALDTTEDWDVLVRAAAVTGVVDTPAVTAVYRVWGDGEGSRHLHDGAQWQASREAVLAKLDRAPLVLAPGVAREVRELHRALAEETEEKYRFAALNEQAASDLRAVNDAVAALREQVADLKERNARLRRRLR
nr:glycosyltransferase [Nocardioides sp. zg-1230]